MAVPHYVYSIYVSTCWRTFWICPSFGKFFFVFFVCLFYFLFFNCFIALTLAILLKLKLQTLICKLLQLTRAVPGTRLLAELLLHVKLWKKLPSCLAVLFCIHEPIWVVWIQSWICRKLVWKALEPLWNNPAPVLCSLHLGLPLSICPDAFRVVSQVSETLPVSMIVFFMLLTEYCHWAFLLPPWVFLMSARSCFWTSLVIQALWCVSFV